MEMVMQLLAIENMLKMSNIKEVKYMAIAKLVIGCHDDNDKEYIEVERSCLSHNDLVSRIEFDGLTATVFTNVIAGE